MNRLISADTLKEFVRTKKKDTIERTNTKEEEMMVRIIYNAFMEWIDMQPTVDRIEGKAVLDDSEGIFATGKE